MALLHSARKDLGLPASSFDLTGVDGRQYCLADFKDKKALVIMFICNHCPYVQAIEDRIIQLQRDYADKSVQLIGICSNDPTDYPDDSPENLKKRWQTKDYRFPYLIDASQDVARAYDAVCTPDIFIYDDKRKLVYHGQLDDNWKDAKKVSRHDARNAIDRILRGEPPLVDQNPSMGCSIKWKR